MIAILVFFGAAQGFAICLHLYFKKKKNKKTFYFYALFLFSLAFFNLIYALKLLGISNIGFIPLNAFPFPYKYLIGVGFYFYIKKQIIQEGRIFSKLDYLLFLPAILYGLLRTYWYIILHSGIDEDIFWNVYKSGFFVYNEYVYLIFNLLLTISAIRFLKTNKTQIRGFNIGRKNWEWFLKFSYAFITIIVLNMALAVIVHIVGDNYNGTVYIILLLLNSIYIYWVGFESLTHSKFLFNRFTLKTQKSDKSEIPTPFSLQFEHHINDQEIFTNKNLKLSDLATLVNTTDKKLSLYIHESFGVSFSEYINQLRVEKVKMLMHTEEQKKYTLLAIAEKAGFSSKSSFNAVFKKVTGVTPTQYRGTNKY